MRPRRDESTKWLAFLVYLLCKTSCAIAKPYKGCLAKNHLAVKEGQKFSMIMLLFKVHLKSNMTSHESISVSAGICKKIFRTIRPHERKRIRDLQCGSRKQG